MSDLTFVLKYYGLQADDHLLDLGRLGHSMVGAEKLVNTGLVVLGTGRIPKQRERFPLVVRTGPPRSGSVELVIAIQASFGVLPLVHEKFWSQAVEIIWNWLAAVIFSKGGRMKDADPHIMKAAELLGEMHKGIRDDAEANRQFVLDVIDRMQPAARNFLDPVGPSCDQLKFGDPKNSKMQSVVDVPIADAVRSNDDIEVGDLTELRVTVDGIIHHSKSLKVVDPENADRYVTAPIRDPAFDNLPNIYGDAAGNKSDLLVTAKPARKGGLLHKLYIVDAKQIE